MITIQKEDNQNVVPIEQLKEILAEVNRLKAEIKELRSMLNVNSETKYSTILKCEKGFDHVIAWESPEGCETKDSLERWKDWNTLYRSYEFVSDKKEAEERIKTIVLFKTKSQK